MVHVKMSMKAVSYTHLIGKTGESKWFAAYKKEGKYCYLKGEDISYEDFLAYLKKRL